MLSSLKSALTKLRTGLMVLLFVPICLWGYTETTSIADILIYPEPGTLVILDLDDTLIRYPSHLGSTAWFEEACKRLEIGEFHRIAGFLAQNLQVVTVEEATSAQIAAAQKRGLSIMGVTRRFCHHPGCPNWSDVTVQQVESVGITFNPPKQEGLCGGILITDGKSKGEVLRDWLQGEEHSQILFVDDRLSEVEDVERALSSDYPLRSIWYRYQELKGLRYDPDLAERELALHPWVSVQPP